VLCNKREKCAFSAGDLVCLFVCLFVGVFYSEVIEWSSINLILGGASLLFGGTFNFDENQTPFKSAERTERLDMI
jgi:hypothetical protein